MKIKKASEKDIKTVAKIYVDGWKTTYRGLLPDEYLDNLSYDEAEQKWRNFLNSDTEPFIYMAVTDAGESAGFAAGKNSDDENFAGELYALYLLPEYRGFGAGRRLVSAIAKHFKENGIPSMLVWVMEKNQSGYRFYKRLEGKAFLRRKSTFGETVVDDIAYGWEDVTVLF